jgi:hypothetical protein
MVQLLCSLFRFVEQRGFVRYRRFRNRSNFQGQDIEEESLFLGHLDAGYGTDNLSRNFFKNQITLHNEAE